MNELDFTVFIPSILSAVVVGAVAYYFFKTHTDYLSRQKQIDLKLKNREITLPMRIQAFERLTLFVERISLVNLLNRVKPISQDKEAYEHLLLKNIEQEYEHNMVQQLYVSQEAWNIIKTAKNSVANTIRKTNMSNQINDANKLRETLFLDLIEQKNTPTDIALQVLKKELKHFL